MRLGRVPLLVVADHVINLRLLVNAYVEESDTYAKKWCIRYFMDTAYTQEDGEGEHGIVIEFKTKKAALETLATIATAADSFVIEDE